jgi:hypothetical protein
MPKIAASLVYTGSSSFLRNSVVELDAGGEIMSVSAGGESFREMAGVEFYGGILVPGLCDIMCGDRGNRWLMGRGVRACGRIGFQSEHASATWKSLYGGMVDCRVFRHMDHFMEYFTPGEFKGVYHAIRLKGNPPVLAGWGLVNLVELMFELQQGPGRFSLPVLLEMATGNGARALGFAGTGSLMPGTRPGLNIIEGVDISAMRLLPESRIRRLY